MNQGCPTLNFMTCAETVRALSKSQNWPARLVVLKMKGAFLRSFHSKSHQPHAYIDLINWLTCLNSFDERWNSGKHTKSSLSPKLKTKLPRGTGTTLFQNHVCWKSEKSMMRNALFPGLSPNIQMEHKCLVLLWLHQLFLGVLLYPSNWLAELMDPQYQLPQSVHIHLTTR